MKHFYVYYSYEEWGRGYIGRRECNCHPEEDSRYFGSFKDKSFNPTQKIILAVFKSKEEMCQSEVDLHLYFEVDKNHHFANKAKQTSKNFSFDFTGVKRPPKTREQIDNHRKSTIGQKWYHKYDEDGSCVVRKFKGVPPEGWVLGRGPNLKRQDRSDLKWFHRVLLNGEVERKLMKEPPSGEWEPGCTPEGNASQAGTYWYTLFLPEGEVKYRMFRHPPGSPWIKGRIGFTPHPVPL
jgi:hypothetical protein